VVIEGDYSVGLLAGNADDGLTVTNITVSNLQINGGGAVGGLIGSLDSPGNPISINNIQISDSEIISLYGYTGGLFGEAYLNDASVTINRITFEGFINQDESVTDINSGYGGVFGYFEIQSSDVNSLTTISNIYVNAEIGNVYTTSVGGIIGSAQIYNYDEENLTTRVDVDKVYTNGVFTGSESIGGLIGRTGNFNNENEGIVITNSFSIAQIIPAESYTATFGTLIGRYGANGFFANQSQNNYFVPSINPGLVCYGTNLLNGCNEVENADYFTNPENEPLSSWNFTTIWRIDPSVNSGLPYLTTETILDTDGDGILDEIEDASANNGDANADGARDALKVNVGTFLNEETGFYVVLYAPDVCSIDQITTESESSLPVQDVAYSYPGGLVDFTIDCETPGYEAELQVFYYGLNPENPILRKFMSTNNTFTSMLDAEFETVTIGGQQAISFTYKIVDGGDYDMDGEANGVIVDPIGMAVQALGAPNTGLGGRSRE
jgi:hypothetical protein